MLFTKGIEVEQYTGLSNGQVIPLSALISQHLEGFTVEPDQRNVEFITPAVTSYDELLEHTIKSRMKLRSFLQSQNPDWTVVPGSTLTLPFEHNFIFSKPEDAYHQHIHKTHGLSIITTSIHYNIGINDTEELIRVVNLMRLEAPLILALTACSPFLDGQHTGNQSSRWKTFPKVPTIVPFFDSHAHFINWIEKNIEDGHMFNVRHFWSSVRPNGNNRPKQLNRLEVRIADLSTNWATVMAIMAWIEVRVQYFLGRPDLKVPSEDETLIVLSDTNEDYAATQGLHAPFSDWIDEEETSCFSAVESRLNDMSDLANELGITKHLKPIENILNEGNESSQLLEKFEEGHSLETIMEDWVQESQEEDLKVAAHCKA